ncbi:GDP-L-fucose synthase [Synechococcus sp. Minos11]|uniref:GDP-L-fucose synthase family protein n=1 Tax=Synechococcus sp. Minos11 TaxID=221341 RepID=UPI0016485A9D|nr:GDP-L-fucose synthase [Synechococcus sp. Minos11]QNJ07684.1 GDP-L-fucose synthase [Synechococcus sp. Minos11]
MNLINFQDTFAVFGATGMAGSAISRALVSRGYSNLLLPSRNDLDLLDNKAVDIWMDLHSPDVLILAAAKVGGIHANTTFPADFLLENLKIQTNVIESAWRHGVRRLLFLGSSCIYPKFAAQPITEDSLLTGPLETTNEFYAIAKIAGLKLCASLRKQYNFDAISLMPTNLYGPGDNYHALNSHVLPALVRKFVVASNVGSPFVECWGTGSPRREFMHVDDLGSASVFVLENWDPNALNSPLDTHGNPLLHLNVGTGNDITITELVNLIAHKTGFTGQIKWNTSYPDGTPQKLLDISSLSQLGWTPLVDLSTGLDSTIKDFSEMYASMNS